ncbi:HAD-IA family hydrolase [Streptomyces sp. HNM0663]|uniref:HAD-IA family hydrolase n=1 Tax=Streptomyces chengmaiensis TaxID=3040919 RepID=A0ABT6HGG8_9ACTN|nr:HAD-IA family hydrolase [Streptomyces chengmaiensis]MDH2387866.1 HAD-IA family hydrolase [Streptomyces chengmaiensis]
MVVTGAAVSGRLSVGVDATTGRSVPHGGARTGRVDAVVFDIGGSIYDDERFVEALYRAVHELVGDVDESEFWSLYETEREGGTGLREAFARRFLHDDDIGVLHAHIARHWAYPVESLYPDVAPVLRALADDYRLGILSNSPPQVRDALRRDGLAPLFGAIVLGGEDSAEKPAAEAFRTVLDRLGVSAEHAVHVGNRLDSDVRGARDAGLRTVWLLRGEAPPAPSRDDLAEADAVVTSLTGLPTALSRLAGGAPPPRARRAAPAALDITGQYRTRQRLAVMNAASVRLGTSLDASETARELTRVAIGHFSDFAAVDLFEDVLHSVGPSSRHAAPPLLRVAQDSVLEGCPESAARPGQPCLHHPLSPMARALDAQAPSGHWADDRDILEWFDNDPRHAGILRLHRVHSLIAAPLHARGTLLGVVHYLRHRTPDPFDADDVLLAREITTRAALAIDNARRYARERSTSLALQRSLLPRHEARFSAADIASRYVPAESGAGVGGDWFDVIPLSGARVGLMVGDVVGHGIEASATMGRLRTAALTLADIDLPPDELLTHLDDLVLRLDEEEPTGHAATPEQHTPVAGATCLYAVYDPVSRYCTVARAGHPPPAVVSPDGTVCFPDLPNGPPLGVGGLPFESESLELARGSVIALYTDGLPHSGSHDLDEGLRLLGDLLAGPPASLEELCDKVLHGLSPGKHEDDAVLLLARTRALDPSLVATWEVAADPAEVARVRHLVAGRLTQWGLEDLSFTTELVVSELVTNAIRYARPPLTLRLIRDSVLMCEVSDASSTTPHRKRSRAFDEGGRGLLLVAQLTRRWGTRYTPSGKTVWAEQDI